VTTLTVSIGVTSSGLTVSGGDQLIVQGGAEVVSTTIDNGGSATIEGGAIMSGAEVSSGGFLTLQSPAIVSGVIVDSGGSIMDPLIDVLGDGESFDVTGAPVTSTTTAGGVTALSGATLSLTEFEIQSGGALTIGGGLGATFVQIDSGASFAMSSGIVLSQATVLAGGQLLGGGGQVDNTLVFGFVEDLTVADLGLVVESGGSALSLTVFESALNVNAGASVTSTTLSSTPSDAATVALVWGSSLDTVVGYNAVEVVSSGGVSLDATVQSGGRQNADGGLVLSATVESGGNEYVESGGVLSASTVLSGGILTISSPGGIVSNVTIDSGGLAIDRASLVIGSGQSFVDDYGPSGAVVASTTVLGGLTVLSGGVLQAFNFELESGGSLTIDTGAPVSSAIVDSGAVLSLGATQSLDATTVSAGGQLLGGTLAAQYQGFDSTDAGLVSGLALNGLQIELEVAAGGVADALDAIEGDIFVDPGGVVSGATLSNGTLMVVSGTASNTILDYGTLVEEGPGVLVGASGTGTIDYQGIVISGATLASPTVVYEITTYNGAYGKLENSDVTAASTLIEGYGAQMVSCTVEGALIASGSTFYTTIDGPAVGVVETYGYFLGGDIASGSTLVVSQYANVDNTTVEGTLVVEGVASGIVFDGGTVEQIGSGAIVAGGSGSGTLIFGGGFTLQSATLNAPHIVYEIAYGAQLLASDVTSVSTVVIDPGANAGGDTVEGELILDSGAQIGGAGLTLVGGEAIIGGSVNSAGTVIGFSGSGGDLVIDDVGAFNGVISGFSTSGQKIDLGGYTFSAGETVTWTEAASNLSGVLTVSGAGMTANLTLLGDYATSNFSLSDDGIGGTFITDPTASGGGGTIAAGHSTAAQTPAPIQGGHVASFAQAMAMFSEPHAHAGWIASTHSFGFGQSNSALFVGGAVSGTG
jgi:autotransporter passenger strand-loop-strand repeat protein